MWTELWNSFEAKAAEVIAGGPIDDAIKQTIMWQRMGHPQFVGAAIADAALQLPELYSGCPWNHAKKWIAFVTINPSIHPNEIYPGLADRATHGGELLQQFFTGRFQNDGPLPGPGPLVHGRNRARVGTWRNRDNPTYHGQKTWAKIDRAVRACLELAVEPVPSAPLGETAAIIDIVPWKFARWSAVPFAVKSQLLELGTPYFMQTLREHTPAVMIAAGESVRRLMHDLQPLGIPPYARHRRQVGTFLVGATRIPWFGVVAPTGNRFYEEIHAIAPQILGHLDLPLR